MLCEIESKEHNEISVNFFYQGKWKYCKLQEPVRKFINETVFQKLLRRKNRTEGTIEVLVSI